MKTTSFLSPVHDRNTASTGKAKTEAVEAEPFLPSLEKSEYYV